jgi:hypothetical protein
MDQMKGLWQYRFTRVFIMMTLLTMLLGLVGVPFLHSRTTARAASSSCLLNSAKGDIQHVISITFDNTHFTRDNPNVPSDLEQMPHLLNFMEGNGVLLTNHHTPLISHTATDILTSLTGVYGDRHGVPVANSFRYFTPSGMSNTGVSFAYWNAPLFDPSIPVPPIDTNFNMLTAQGKNAPAPWVPFTRTGCNFGAVATANTILENTAVDVSTVFGPNSPQQQEVLNAPKPPDPLSTLPQADFVGIGIHCASGNALCSSANTGVSDVLPDEPGGYSGFNALFGNKYVAPQISPNGPMTDLFGNVIKDPNGNLGFPGFDGMSAAVSLGYVAAMQEHGVPVTYAYISDAHDAHPNGPAFGPGQDGYVKALKSYDDAFATFFSRLASDGINQSNTLFVFTSDEGDHFVGGPPSPAGCDGVNVPCTYSQIGELNANLSGLLGTERGNTTPFRVHSDSAPTIYITGNPARDAAVTRTFDRDLGQLTALNPITGNTDKLTQFLADSVEMKLLHMVTADPARTPTLTMFADPNYFLFTSGIACPTPNPASCVTEQPGFAWNHGMVSPDVNVTWLGMVGPGVRNIGVDNSIWSDHTDVRPTMMTLLGLKDDYSHDGRALFEDLYAWAVPQSLRAHRATLIRLAQVYKQLDACVGQFGLETLSVSTRALESSASGDTTYITLENELISFGNQRDGLAAQMIGLMEGATFNGMSINEQQAKSLIAQGQELLNQVNSL